LYNPHHAPDKEKQMQQAHGVLATASTLETAVAVRTGTVSAVETTEAAIARIDAAVAKGRTCPSPVSP
jgi:hypothetical protein